MQHVLLLVWELTQQVGGHMSNVGNLGWNTLLLSHDESLIGNCLLLQCSLVGCLVYRLVFDGLIDMWWQAGAQRWALRSWPGQLWLVLGSLQSCSHSCICCQGLLHVVIALKAWGAGPHGWGCARERRWGGCHGRVGG